MLRKVTGRHSSKKQQQQQQQQHWTCCRCCLEGENMLGAAIAGCPLLTLAEQPLLLLLLPPLLLPKGQIPASPAQLPLLSLLPPG